ncbi:hypothetical protein ASE74_09955 [Pedobacter sp. Leaf216]|uniref:helix-turn-helix transcriptional regulator n=1 Tax=Pedobacter sp. Leaf216 TaxID=1735684 RepID=UPI0006F24256|nr:response regulator transcription factor [Pedobacter sp. Leaf216]KQM66198.1 hypothetical protein ASE74_09955 [Pedobacter sp. Leaf216]
MEFKLSTCSNGNILYQKSYPENFDSNEDIGEQETDLRTENAALNLKEKWFNGVHMSIMEVETNQKEDFLFETSNSNIGFLFCLNGIIDYYCNHQKGSSLSLTKDQQNINGGKITAINFSLTENSKYLYLQFTKTYFNQITGYQFDNITSFHKQQSISPDIALILKDLMFHNHEGRAKRLFIEAKIFQLLIIYMNQKHEQPKFSLKKDDVNKIMLAKYLVEQDVQKPYSLMELSRKAGINDYKLKKGFKELTGHTVFGYLYKIRMEKAHDLLAKEKRTVNEVAFLVGYKNAQHFIVAFKKKYQILPGILNKN